MSNQYEICVLCEEKCQVSCTNADVDFGVRYFNNKMICAECIKEVTGE